jgi:hypothetical protein
LIAESWTELVLVRGSTTGDFVELPYLQICIGACAAAHPTITAAGEEVLYYSFYEEPHERGVVKAVSLTPGAEPVTVATLG